MSKQTIPTQEETRNAEMDTDVEKELTEQEIPTSLSDTVERIQELEKQLEESAQKEQDLLLRTRAEIDNIRRRSCQDIEKAHKFALEKFSRDLLETIDNLERALTLSSEEISESTKSIIEGVELTLKGLLKTVDTYGIQAVGEVGETFNPDIHHAVKQEQVEGMEPNKIVTVLQKGYTLNGRIIRPAMVIISA